MKAQAYSRNDDDTLKSYTSQKKTLEINPRHPLIKKLLAFIVEDEENEEPVNQDKALDLT